MKMLTDVFDSIVICSGGADPLHNGHVRLIKHSAVHGAVVWLLNSDDWLIRKKGYVFMPWASRAEIIENIRNVSHVFGFDDSDDTACEGIKLVKGLFPDHKIYFANGGDRNEGNVPESDLCKKLNITMLWNMGGGKVASSSDIVRKVSRYESKS